MSSYLKIFKLYRPFKWQLLKLSIISFFWSFNISFCVSSVVVAINRNRSQTIIPFYPSRKLNLVSGVCYIQTIWLGILDLVSVQWSIMGINVFTHLPLNFLYYNTVPDIFGYLSHLETLDQILWGKSLSKVAMGVGIIYVHWDQ